MGLVITPPQSVITPRIRGPAPGSLGVPVGVVSSGTTSIVSDRQDLRRGGRGGRRGRAGREAAGERGASGEVGLRAGSGPPPGRGRAAERRSRRGRAPGRQDLRPTRSAAARRPPAGRRPARGPCCGRTRPRPPSRRPRRERAAPTPAAAAPARWSRPRADGRTRRSPGCRAGPRRLVHPLDVDPARVPERVVPAQRVGRRRIVAHPVGVAAPQRGEPGVEPVRGGADRPHPDVGRQLPGQPAAGWAGRPPPRPPPARRRARPGRARARRRRCGPPRSGPAAGRASARPSASCTTCWTVRRPGCRPSRESLSRRRTGPAGAGSHGIRLVPDGRQRAAQGRSRAVAGILRLVVIRPSSSLLSASSSGSSSSSSARVLGAPRRRPASASWPRRPRPVRPRVGRLGRARVRLRGLGRGRLRRAPARPAGRGGRGGGAACASASSRTSSITAIGALSPLRGPILVIRVYPPSRSAKVGPISANSACTTVLSVTWSAPDAGRAGRRAWRR